MAGEKKRQSTRRWGGGRDSKQGRVGLLQPTWREGGGETENKVRGEEKPSMGRRERQ
jgi:hypothetical protein